MPDNDFEPHRHEGMVHSHTHFHVTHNWSDNAQTFEHLSSTHEHEHDHAAVEHAHFPHQDFESEHLNEVHDHDHDEPVKKRAPAKKAATKATAKGTAKKAGVKKAGVKKAAKKAT